MAEYEGYAILELMGHRRLIGRISEATIAGAPMVRIDVLDVEGNSNTQYYSAQAVYAITPTTEETARRAASLNTVAPISRWELPAPAIEKAAPAAASEEDEPWEEEIGIADRDRTATINWACDLLERDDWVILDTETTGLGDDAEVVQIGVLSPAGDVLLDTYVRPVRPIPAEASRIHGIMDSDVADAPPFAELQPQLDDLLAGKRVVIYNAEFDTRLLNQSARLSGAPLLLFGRSTACAMLRYAAYVGEWSEQHGSYRYQKLPGGDHTAIGDCRAVLALIRLMAEDDDADDDGFHL